MSPSQIPSNRSLTIVDKDGVIRPDILKRMMRLFEKKKASSRKYIRLRNIIIFLAAGLFVVMIGGAELFEFQKEDAVMALFITAFFAAFFGAIGLHFWLRGEKVLLFPCPHCPADINLLDQWICGNCKKTNNDERHEFSTVLHECEEEVCSLPKQSAFICPNCEAAIIIDKALWDQLKSHQKPHVGVAQYLSMDAAINQMLEMASQLQNKPDKQFFDN